ncbi:MAG TPA: hypothetical protein VGL46_15025 [Pseudonocardiaceae bacterium]
MNDHALNDDQFLRLSDAITGAFAADGGFDQSGYATALTEAYAAGMVADLMLAWAMVLASTHTSAQRPLDSYVDRLAEEIEGPVCEAVRHHGQALIDTARDGDDDAMHAGWLTVLEALDADGVNWLAWALAAAVAPVMPTLGGLEHFLAAAEMVRMAAGRAQEVTFFDIRAVAAALCAVTAGARDAARVYLSLPNIHHTVECLSALIPGLLRGAPATVYTLDDDGVLSGIADPADPDVQRLTAVIAAGTTSDPARAAAIFNAAAPAESREDVELLLWHLTLALGASLVRMFAD